MSYFDDIPTMRRVTAGLNPDYLTGLGPSSGDYGPPNVPMSTNDIWRAKALIAQYPKRPENNIGSEPQVALNVFEKLAISPFAGKAKSALGSLTNGALSKPQIDSLYGQVTDNIEWKDMMRFKDINPDSRPITLSPDQSTILRDQIDQLTPEELREAIKEQLGIAHRNGVVAYPEDQE